jgi:alkylmercury lyase
MTRPKPIRFGAYDGGGCTEKLDPADQRTQLALFRLLAAGRPVELAKLARAARLEASDVAARLERWHGVHADDAGRIVAFQGLSVVEAPHRDACRWADSLRLVRVDTLFLPELIGKPTDVESNCPSTGATVSLRVGPGGPADLSPAEAVMSFVFPGTCFREDTIASFCNSIHYFASPRAAAQWTAERPVSANVDGETFGGSHDECHGEVRTFATTAPPFARLPSEHR